MQYQACTLQIPKESGLLLNPFAYQQRLIK